MPKKEQQRSVVDEYNTQFCLVEGNDDKKNMTMIVLLSGLGLFAKMKIANYKIISTFVQVLTMNNVSCVSFFLSNDHMESKAFILLNYLFILSLLIRL